MNIPEEFREVVESLPPVLRALLDAELAAGNEIAEVGHSFPAPPVGATIKLARPVTTRPRAAGGGLKFRDFNSSIYSGEFTDERGFFFIVEPPAPPPDEPDMDAIRAGKVPKPAPLSKPMPIQRERETIAKGPIERFKSSMVIDYEKWHDGIGYDLEALRDASPEERTTIETMLIDGGVRDWRDVEALGALNTPRARKALKAALKSDDHQVRMAIVRYASELVPNAKRSVLLVEALGSAEFYGGLTEALDEVEEFHPPKVIDALLRGVLAREGEVAVHFAAMLMFIYGKTSEPFDMEQRPFFLTFNTEEQTAREAAFRKLCEKIGVIAQKYFETSVSGGGGRKGASRKNV